MTRMIPNSMTFIDGKGGGERQDYLAPGREAPDGGMLWVHLDRDSAEAKLWLERDSGLDELSVEALLAEETRPRCVSMDDGTLLVLRGVNLNPGAEPDDMVAVRILIQPRCVISSRHRRLMSIDDLRAALAAGRGPRAPGEFVVELIHHLVSRIAVAVGNVEDEVDRLQAQVLESEAQRLRTELSRIRREIIVLRRYLAPQRDALNQLYLLKASWLDDQNLQKLREETDRITRLVEDLDAARERAAVTQEELSSRLSDQLNSRMYVLTVVAGVFLPLGFLTGLLGINVGGVPLADDAWGFAWVVLALVVITAAEIAFFRWRRWV